MSATHPDHNDACFSDHDNALPRVQSALEHVAVVEKTEPLEDLALVQLRAALVQQEREERREAEPEEGDEQPGDRAEKVVRAIEASHAEVWREVGDAGDGEGQAVEHGEAGACERAVGRVEHEDDGREPLLLREVGAQVAAGGSSDIRCRRATDKCAAAACAHSARSRTLVSTCAYSGPAVAPSQLVRIRGQDCREFRHQQPSTSPYTRGGC